MSADTRWREFEWDKAPRMPPGPHKKAEAVRGHECSSAPDQVVRQTSEMVKLVFKQNAELDLALFPKDSTDIPDRAALTLAVLRPDEVWDASTESQVHQ